MKIIKNIKVPTGNILVVNGEGGMLECLSLGDYGKDVNLKADFLGLKRNIKKVNHTKLLPLEEKWVATLSTQHGCSMGCEFCDVPRVGPGRNASLKDLMSQLKCVLKLHPKVGKIKRLNIHFARMGEPTFNPNVLEMGYELAGFMEEGRKSNLIDVVHPVVSTMMPRNHTFLKLFIKEWMRIKNELFNGEAGLQISVNSTDEGLRNKMFRSHQLGLSEIAHMMEDIERPIGRKITLNFAVSDKYKIDPKVLIRYFDPDYYLIKLTPMHKTTNATYHGIKTLGDYTTMAPYEKIEKSLKRVGFDVIVFIASKEEDESKITCGNAVLATGQRKNK